MSLVQDFDHHVDLMNLSVVSDLLPHTGEELGERTLAKTLTLKCSSETTLKHFREDRHAS